MPPDRDLLAGVFDAVDVGLVILDADARIQGWNGWMAMASGIPAEDARGARLDEVFPRLSSPRFAAAVADALGAGISSVLTHSLHPRLFELKTRSGRPMVHSLVIHPIAGEAGRCVIQVTDVTVATERDRILRERQNARYDAVVESAPDAILTLDVEGVIQMANPAAAAEFGYARDELVGRPISVLIRDQPDWDGAWARLLAAAPMAWPIEVVVARRNGSLSHVELSASRWRSDERVFVTAILHDVNERREAEEALRGLNQTLETRVDERTAELVRAQEALRQSQKMEALGQLTGGIAHDFNNLLTGILGSMDILKRRIAAKRYEDVDRFMDAASTSANRAAALTHRLLAFARRQPLDPQPLDLNRLVNGMEDLLRRSLGEQVELRIDLGEDVWPALTDANQLESVLLNLAINSRDAMPRGGRLTIETENLDLSAPDGQGEDAIEPGEYALVSVTDTGVGMTPETLAKVFDPFFTTKPIGQGTGLGLSMIYGFAKQSRGHVRIESEVGEGTTVKLYLPRHRGVAVAPSDDRPLVPLARGDGETVLLVEDDPSVRLLIAEVLRELGYASMEAADAQGAAPVLSSNVRLDLMITDVGLPGLNGRQLAEIARQHRPGLKILFVTGYAEHATQRNEFLEPGMEMVTKPFALDGLALKIREMIEPVKR
jgi:PAS domain S-box-containing protein